MLAEKFVKNNFAYQSIDKEFTVLSQIVTDTWLQKEFKKPFTSWSQL